MERTLSREHARRAYDRIGAMQDTQRVYEDVPVTALVAHSDFPSARSVVEFGCGTGRHAKRLLDDALPSGARYLALDQSTTMTQLARDRLAHFGDRVEVRQTSGSPELDIRDASFDRFFSTYVLDLLSYDDIARVIAEAHRVLVPNGRLCLVSLTEGTSPTQRLAVGVARGIFRVSPALIGGCRPVNIAGALDLAKWRIVHREVVSRFWIPSEVIVAEPIKDVS